MTLPANQTVVPPTDTPPAQTQTPNTTTPPAATTLENPSASTNPASTPSSSDQTPAPAAVIPPAPVPVATEEDYDLEVDEASPLSDAELQSIAQYAEKYGLSKEDAQATVAAQESLYTRGRSEIETVQTQELEKKRQALVSHPDFSGEKAKDSWDSVNLAVQAFGTPELVAALNDPHKHGYDLSVAIMLKNIGDQLKPEIPVGKGAAMPLGKQAQDAEDAKLRRLYPNLYKDEK